jgi:CheY-like chemotaxis protein
MEPPCSEIYFLAVESGQLSGFDRPDSKSERQDAAQPGILVVDDEKLLADTTAAILRRAGYNAKIAYNGFDALEAMGSQRPDYLLTDILMPGMNGVELAIAVTSMSPATKILLFSGQAGIIDILERSRARGFEFPLLAKPVHPSQLIQTLRNLQDE